MGCAGRGGDCSEESDPESKKGKWCEVTAIAFRAMRGRPRTLRNIGVAKAYGSYESAAADPELSHLQSAAESFARALVDQSGGSGEARPVEKPLSLTVAEARAADGAGPLRREVGEAFHGEDAPQWMRAHDLIRHGVLGNAVDRGSVSYFSRSKKRAKRCRMGRRWTGWTSDAIRS